MEKKKQNITSENIHRIIAFVLHPMFLRTTGLFGTLKSQQGYVYFRGETK